MNTHSHIFPTHAHTDTHYTHILLHTHTFPIHTYTYYIYIHIPTLPTHSHKHTHIHMLHTYYTHTHTFPIHIHKHVCAAHIGFLGVNHDFMAYIPVCTSFFFSPTIWYTSRQYLERMNGLGRPSISTHTDMPHSFWQLHNLLCTDVTKFT